MKIFAGLFSIIIFFSVVTPRCLALDAWPGSAGTVIATYSDASGAVWHEARQSLFVVQNSGRLNEINASGTLIDQWDIAGDLEGVALAENNRYLYIGIENPDSIVEFDLQTEALTGKSWDLTPWMTGDANLGLEALSYRNSHFYAGLQADGKIYVFNVNLNVSGEVSYVQTITPFAGYTDIAGLDYNSSTGITYAVFDTANALIELNSNNEVANHYELPGSAQEGIAVNPSCLNHTADVYITNDDTGQVIRYPNYPVTCLDADSDGVSNATDCNDYDASISGNQTYYRDADGDGLGDASTTTGICSLTAPDGYVTNSTDTVDIASNGRLMYINGSEYAFFDSVPNRIKYTHLNYYSDSYEEVIAVGLYKKKAIIVSARVNGNNVTIVKRVAVKKRYKSISLTTQLTKKKFVTKFNGRKKYTWKIKSSGSFSRSR
jgi:hypothetical protein